MELEFRALVYEGLGKPRKTNCGKIVEVRVNLGETGMGRVFVATHSCSVQSEMLNEAHAKNKKNKTKKYIYIYLSYEIFTDMYRIRKVSKP